MSDVAAAVPASVGIFSAAQTRGLLGRGFIVRKDSLAEVLSEFARTLVTDFPIQGILDHLVRRIVDILPINAAGVSLISQTTSPRLIAGSDESAMRYEHLQTELGEGPCLAAYETDAAIAIANLAEDDRFPRFAERALAEGLVAVFTFPLRNGDRCLGALDLYRTTAGGLSEEDMETAQTLADVATAYLLNAESRSAKADFIATVSHEFRTPLASISGFVELLQEEGGLTEQQKGFVDAVVRNSDRLTSLVDNLLTVASQDAGGKGRERVDLDLGAVLSAAQKVLQPAIAASSVEVSFTIPPDPVMVCGNYADLEAVVTNLVGNGLKFTADGGWVRCTLRTIDGGAQIDVSDNGLGVPREEQQDLFKRFFRSSTARAQAIQGSGLGLTIVNAIAQSHGGDVSVVSEHLRGSTFTVRIPLCVNWPTPSVSDEPVDAAPPSAGVRV